jgi:hypothetical protein
MSSREASSDRYRATSCTLGKQHPSRRRGAYDRHWCFGSPLPLAGAPGVGRARAAAGRDQQSVWRIMPISVEWRIESTADHPWSPSLPWRRTRT